MDKEKVIENQERFTNHKIFGRIVNVGSINGRAGQYGQVNYAAAKSGIHGLRTCLKW